MSAWRWKSNLKICLPARPRNDCIKKDIIVFRVGSWGSHERALQTSRKFRLESRPTDGIAQIDPVRIPDRWLRPLSLLAHACIYSHESPEHSSSIHRQPPFSTAYSTLALASVTRSVSSKTANKSSIN